MTKDDLQNRKKLLVRDAIFDAAIELFAVKGFDETTVEEVAQAAVFLGVLSSAISPARMICWRRTSCITELSLPPP